MKDKELRAKVDALVRLVGDPAGAWILSPTERIREHPDSERDANGMYLYRNYVTITKAMEELVGIVESLIDHLGLQYHGSTTQTIQAKFVKKDEGSGT